MKLLTWPIVVEAETHDMRGRKVRMSRTVEGTDGPCAAILAALAQRHDKGRAFIGCEVVAFTPLMQRTIRIVEECDGAIVLVPA